MRMQDLNRMESLVPWVATLVRKAEDNWPKILRFLVQENNLDRVSSQFAHPGLTLKFVACNLCA